MEKDEFGVWNVIVPAIEGGLPAIPHNSKVKVFALSRLRLI